MTQFYSFPGGTPIENPPRPHHTYQNGGGDGGGDSMQQRVQKLEENVQQMKTNIAVIHSNYATKSDVSDAKTSIIIWVVGAVVFSQLIPTIPGILAALFHI